MKLDNQYPSLRSRLSQGGYTLEASELNCDIFNHSTLAKSFSKPSYFDMGVNFGTKESATAFPSLPAPANTWKTPQENQLAILGNLNQPSDKQSFASTND